MILYRDDHWLAVDKPTGLATHAPQPGELGVVEWLELHLGLRAHIVSRLDRGTSGVLLLAMDAGASARAEDIHTQGGATKIYEFLSPLDSRSVGLPDRWQCTDELDGKPARTWFERLEVCGRGPRLDGAAASGLKDGQPLFRYVAEITRGRRHQIRRHAAAAGLSILGDREHGGAGWPRLCLHCREIRWPEIADPIRSARPPSFENLTANGNDVDLELALCRDRRGSWLADITDCQRLVSRNELGSLPVAIDIYGQWFSAISFSEDDDAKAVHAALQPVCERIMSNYGCSGGVIRSHRRNPHQHDLVAGLQSVGEPSPDRFLVREHDLLYEISLTQTQHTGLFLDQRDSRRRVALLAENSRLANLFAFTCSFSVAAAAHGAEVAFSVDVARPCLSTGKRNFAANSLTETGRGKFIQEDARKWLRRQLRRHADAVDFRPLDLVICDPPVFASSKDGGKFSVQQEWSFLAEAVATLLDPAGTALFANNHRAGDANRYRQQLSEHFATVTRLLPPLDFPELAGEGAHVRTFLCREPITPGNRGNSPYAGKQAGVFPVI